MTELLPCPFCGSGWLYETRRNGYCNETPTMFCNSCKAVVTWEQVEEEGVNDKTKAFVREHWNSRAELGSDEPPYDELLRCLENDWHISASWDGLRKFWCIELTEDGVKLRDAERGTLTAEQVREATYAHSINADCADADWQAIADELNSRAERTCECIAEYAKSPIDGKTIVLHRCSSCHELMRPYMNYCPNCGARVKR